MPVLSSATPVSSHTGIRPLLPCPVPTGYAHHSRLKTHADTPTSAAFVSGGRELAQRVMRRGLRRTELGGPGARPRAL